MCDGVGRGPRGGRRAQGTSTGEKAEHVAWHLKVLGKGRRMQGAGQQYEGVGGARDWGVE